MKICLTLILVAFDLLHSANSAPEENPTLATLANLLSESQTQPSKDLIDDQQYQRQLELLLAELQSQLMGTKKAQEFFQDATKYGLPSFDNLKFRDNYIVSYDNSLRHPIWVLECLKGSRVRRSKTINRMSDGFDIDKSVHEYFRATDDDYRGSGFDRGHYSAACNNKCNREQLNQSYLYTNVAPHVPGLSRNKRIWTRLESYVVFLSRRSRSTYVITGSLYLPKKIRNVQDDADEQVRYRVIGLNRVAVPDFFYKIILYESNAGHPSMEAFVLPNCEQLDGSEELQRYRINIAYDLPKIEEFAGLRFFDLQSRGSLGLPTRFKYGYREMIPGRD